IDIYPVNHRGIEYDPERIPEVLADLNSWLFAGMQDRDALWQSLPLGTYWYLICFCGITGSPDKYWLEYWLGHYRWYEPVGRVAGQATGDAGKGWRDLRSSGLAEEGACGGSSRYRLFNAAIAAVAAGFLDFLSAAFPDLTPASIREVWRQRGLSMPSCTLSR